MFIGLGVIIVGASHQKAPDKLTGKDRIKYEQMYHPTKTTLTASAVTKNFTPYNGFKWDAGNDSQDIGKQVDGYLKSIRNLKDYTVRVSTSNAGMYGGNLSETVTLNRK